MQHRMQSSSGRAGKYSAALLILLALLLAVILPVGQAFAEKSPEKKSAYQNFQEVALAMHDVFERAIHQVDTGDMDGAYNSMNEAYFQFYEVEGFEKYVGYSISAKRVAEIEGMFRNIKFHIKGKREKLSKEELKDEILQLSIKCYRDALVLDGVADKNSSDDIGRAVIEKKGVQQADVAQVRAASFITSFTLMLREGLEAILICIAIITYLIKAGQRQLCRGVYLGMLAGVVGSVFLAILVNFALQGAGQELVEGWTMFLAVAVLFYVSHWMLHRSEEEAWEAYIERQVSRSLSKQSQYVLIGAAFLAVIREGAELILFYKAALSSATTDNTFALLGFGAAVAVLAIIWFVFRFTTIKLPLRPFFMFTSILLFVLCISFMGKGVVELTEAGVITGGTVIPAMNGFNFDWLGIYDRAETLIPQLMLLIASVWIVVASAVRQRRIRQQETGASSQQVGKGSSDLPVCACGGEH